MALQSSYFHVITTDCRELNTTIWYRSVAPNQTEFREDFRIRLKLNCGKRRPTQSMASSSVFTVLGTNIKYEGREAPSPPKRNDDHVDTTLFFFFFKI